MKSVMMRKAVRPVGAAVASLALAGMFAACGSSSSPASSLPVLVVPPPAQVQNCGWVPTGANGAQQVVPGVQPAFKAATTTKEANAVWTSIRNHGGRGAVDSFQIPSGAALYAGPSTSLAPVGKVSPSQQLGVSDPVVVAVNGQTWLAFFLACGGSTPYWVNVGQVTSVNAATGHEITQALATMARSKPFTETGGVSFLPVEITSTKVIEWKASGIQFYPARGQLVPE